MNAPVSRDARAVSRNRPSGPFLCLLPGNEIQRSRVHAVPLVSRRRCVIEYMAQVGVTAAAQHLIANHAVRRVSPHGDVLFGDRLPKAGHPVPDSNFVLESKRNVLQQMQV